MQLQHQLELQLEKQLFSPLNQLVPKIQHRVSLKEGANVDDLRPKASAPCEAQLNQQNLLFLIQLLQHLLGKWPQLG